MTRVLDARRRAPASGRTATAVVLLHGYGADGADLIGLAEPVANYLPDTLFVAPDAPEICAVNPAGRQWFPIPWIDGASEEAAERSMRASLADLDTFLDRLMTAEGLRPSDVALLGFSQGTMMALHLAPRRPEAFAAVVGFSGRLLQPEMLADELQVRMPILLAHGDADEVVPPQSLPEAAEALTAAGFEVYAHVMKGTGHGIAPDGLGAAVGFLRERLSPRAGGSAAPVAR